MDPVKGWNGGVPAHVGSKHPRQFLYLYFYYGFIILWLILGMVESGKILVRSVCLILLIAAIILSLSYCGKDGWWIQWTFCGPMLAFALLNVIQPIDEPGVYGGRVSLDNVPFLQYTAFAANERALF